MPASAGDSAELNRCLKLSAKKKYEQAVECLEVYKSRFPGGDRAASADLHIADSYFRQKEYLLAAETYQEFIRLYPFHPKQDYAYYQSGMAYLRDNPKAIDRDQEYLDLAAQNFSMVIRYFPNSPYHRLAEQQYRRALSKQAHKHYYVGRFYYKYSEYLAAIPRFAEIVQNFPGLGYDEKSFYYLITALKKTNQPSKAKEVLLVFENRYPDSSWLKKAR